ncbi:[FeFe] hydrogenase H-cluster radical SAM maturase HydE [Ruminococcus sp. FC2018]|uniref:[FeFe] hydrogenase H-cluster radical SAM maturase HydE n=1 Tax=Ruminococcus sp. FC2018 TaxID=1410617 RepID=UPI00055A32F6|nr:[FeFe] hydrogenase H-cluster radical SAM maturase HydE [Ruminococcus sp. FC2018]
MNNKELIDLLEKTRHLDRQQWIALLESYTDEDRAYAAHKAAQTAVKVFGKEIFIRGIVEFSNVCRNDCYYCGIRKSNANCERYRLTKEQILDCCDAGYEYGFRTFVLQSGEDKSFTTDKLCDIVGSIKKAHPDCAVTLSVGELEYEDYKRLFDAGADRYLLRHETANPEHYRKLHPSDMSWQRRMDCLKQLKEIGYQTGCGMMVGAPYQTVEDIADDLMFVERFKPEMIGMGPFIPHKDTPFKDKPAGSYELTLFLISLCRLMLPDCLIPATTALGTIRPDGREHGVMAGANVIMPNLSPMNVRKKYLLYDGKICTGDESAQCRACLERRMESIGYKVIITRGDHKSYDKDSSLR